MPELQVTAAIDPTDRALIDQTLDGQTASFGELVRRYQDRLYRGLLHFCGSPEEAADVAQDAWLQAFGKLASFQHASGFYTWLYRIAVNQLLSQRRRRRPAISLADWDASVVDRVGADGSPDAAQTRRDRADLVRRAMASLSEEHRQVLALREIEEWSYEQISELLGLPIGTVRSRLFRARQELRAKLLPAIEQDML